MPLGELTTHVPAFLQFVLQAFHNRGFDRYVGPRVHWDVNRNGVPFGRRWGLHWDDPENALLFYVFYKDYHCESTNDATVYNLLVRNANFEALGDNPTGRLLVWHPQTTVNPQNFNQIVAHYL
eukprot:4420535-Alexandrium_andersonii.AAC.1